MLSVQEIWRYPVKSMGGEVLADARVDEHGIPHDRGWGVRDLATGMILTGRREPLLLMASAQVIEGRPVITTGDGDHLATDADLSSWLGRTVELAAAADGPGTFENPMNVDDETDWISWRSSHGTFHDGRSRVSLVSIGSLADHERRRFRINVILSGAGEDDFVGHEITIGDAVLRVRRPIDRCVMVARAQPGIPDDLGVLKRVIRERDNLMGVGAVVTTAGTIAVGDPVIPVALP